MASRGAIAAMDAEERQRMARLTGRLAKRFGVDPPAEPEFARQSDLARVFEMRATNDFLERVDAFGKDEGYSAAPGSEGKATDAVEDALSVDGVHLTAEVTQDDTPVVATESIEPAAKSAAKKGKA